VRTGGFGAEIVARLTDSLRDRCPLRIRRVATPDVRMPAAPALQRALLPGVPDIVGAVREVV
jgi:2-oxoisovalerate dehydrogenase E1 component